MDWLIRLLVAPWAFVWACFWTMVFGIVYLAGAPFDKKGGWTDFVQRLFTLVMLWCVFVRVRTVGKENLLPGTPCVVMANHRSYLDIPAIVRGLPGMSTRFVAKRELKKVPFFGWALAASDHIKVDRGNREQAVAALTEASKKMDHGIALMMFSEGTRSVDARLLPFKKGGFYVAVDTAFPILPVSIQNSGRLFGKHNWLPRPGVITVVVHPAITVTGRTRADIPQLMSEVRTAMLRGLPRAAALEAASGGGGSGASASPASGEATG